MIQSNMNIQFVTGVYGMIGYLTSYLCKAEHVMSELMKKAQKEANDENLRGKLRKIGNIEKLENFLTPFFIRGVLKESGPKYPTNFVLHAFFVRIYSIR